MSDSWEWQLILPSAKNFEANSTTAGADLPDRSYKSDVLFLEFVHISQEATGTKNYFPGKICIFHSPALSVGIIHLHWVFSECEIPKSLQTAHQRGRRRFPIENLYRQDFPAFLCSWNLSVHWNAERSQSSFFFFFFIQVFQVSKEDPHKVTRKVGLNFSSVSLIWMNIPLLVSII